MRPLFRGEGCAINEAGISSAGNPLARALDAVTNDQLGARQMREGYLAGMRPPMGGMGPGGQMLDPMGKPGGSLEEAWGAAGPMVGRPGPALGAAMPEQLAQHMARSMGADMREAGFFTDGPVSLPGRPWIAGPGGPPGAGPGMMMQRPPGAQDWAGEFAMRPGMSGPSAMEAAFQEARMRQGEMEAAFSEAASSSAGPMMGGPMMRGPMMGMPMMGMPPMMGGMSMMGGYGPMSQGPMLNMQPAMSSQAAPMTAEAAPIAAEAASESVEQLVGAKEEADLSQAAQMVEMLRNSGNPKFANSQFVSFIDKVSKGDLQFKESTVVDREGKEVDWDSLYDTNAATLSVQDHQQLEHFAQLSSRFNGGAASSTDMMARMEEEWQAAAEAMGDVDNLTDADLERILNTGIPRDLNTMAGLDALMQQVPGGMQDMFANTITGFDREEQYKFVEENNPYLDVDDPMAEALRLLREGRDREAIVYLEAEVQRNPESSEGWRIMGEVYAALDQDAEAIQCLKKGHEVDPYNLDSLLALGVSNTNELHRLPALKNLRCWIENHEEFASLTQGLEPPAEWEADAWKDQVTMLLNQAAQANPLDYQVFVALGVIENIGRNYEAATMALATACRLRPNDHTIWNKLGATLANSNKSEQALVAYHQALLLKPNYARSWSNLAIAHANLNKHDDATRFYLSALMLNPEATHLWGFLHGSVLNMPDASPEQMRAINDRDMDAGRRLFEGVLDPAALPKPAQELPQPPDEILGSIGL